MGAEGQLLVPEEGIRRRRRRLDSEPREERKVEHVQTEGRARTFDYEPKEGHVRSSMNRRKKERHKAHSDFTQVRGPRER